MKLEINDDHFFSQKQKIAYAISRLSKIILNQVIPRLNNNSIGFQEVNGFIQFLKTAFNDLDREITV